MLKHPLSKKHVIIQMIDPKLSRCTIYLFYATILMNCIAGCGRNDAPAPSVIESPSLEAKNGEVDSLPSMDSLDFDLAMPSSPDPAMIQFPDAPAPGIPGIPGVPPDTIARAGDSAPKLDKRVTVAILDFEDTSAENKFENLNRALQSMLTTDLSISRELQLVERARLEDIRNELKLAQSGFLDPTTAAKVGKGVGAKAVLTGSFWIRDDEIRIDARLVHVSSGKVILAEQISGKHRDLNTLEKSLANKIIAATGVRLSAFENAEISQPHTSNILAASRYGQSLADEDAGDFANAQRNARVALQLDPEFALAERQLARIEKDALFRLSTDNKWKAEFSGSVGQQLEQHRSKFRQVAASKTRDARYFASLLILSAHAGLAGDSTEERRLLIKFWDEFSTAVQPADCVTVSLAVRAIAFSEGEFFRQTVDSGSYGISVPAITFGEQDPDFDPEASNLKPELREDYRWPKWSALWPFEEHLRGGYGTLSLMGEINNNWFERFLAKYPHDYLEILANDAWEFAREPSQEGERIMRMMFSICLYYNQIQAMPLDLNEGLSEMHDKIVWQLEDIVPHNQSREFVAEATKILDIIGKVEPDVGKRDRANKLLLRFARQAQLNEGLKGGVDLTASKSLSIFGERLEASTVVFLIRSSSYSGLAIEKHGIHKTVQSELADAVLSLHGVSQSINVFWSTEDSIGDEQAGQLFSEVVVANNENKQKMLQSLTESDPNREYRVQSFDQLLTSLIEEFGPDCCIILDAQDEAVNVDRRVIEQLQNAKSKPRFIVLASARNRDLLNLSIASKGAFVALKSKGGLLGGEDVTATFADLSNAQVRFEE